MILSNYFLWAGLLILIISGAHFLLQRKLMDRGTKCFVEILAKGILICALGIVLTSMRKYPSFMIEDVYMVLLACRYIIQSTVPLDFFMIATVPLNLDVKKYRRRVFFAAVPVSLSLIANIANIFTPVIAYLDSDYNLCQGPFYDAFFVCNIFYCAVVVIYLILNANELGKTRFNAMCEVNVIVMLATMLQYYLQVQFFFGLGLALALSVLYITLNNPTTYIDLQTNAFNAEYFKNYIGEKHSQKKDGYIIIVDLYKFDRIKIIYDNKMSERVFSHICNYMTNMSNSKEVFRIGDNRYAIRFDNIADFEKAAFRLEQFFSKAVKLDDKKIYCQALILKLTRINDLKNVEELLSYIQFLCNHYSPEGETKVYEDTIETKEIFAYEQEVGKYIDEAVSNNSFEVYYQPIYSIKEQKFVSLEALSRLKHPVLGWINPEIFIKVALENGLLLKIMPNQMKRICRFISENREKLSNIQNIKINLSPREAIDKFYFKYMLEIIDEYDIPYDFFQFEITETTAITFSKELEACVKMADELGIDLCMDDFGSGYANMGMLYRLPFKVVKIDKSLIKNISNDEKARFMYKNIVYVLKRSGFAIVAEGVETADEVDIVAKFGVDMIQGFYYSKPLSATEVVEIL